MTAYMPTMRLSRKIRILITLRRLTEWSGLFTLGGALLLLAFALIVFSNVLHSQIPGMLVLCVAVVICSIAYIRTMYQRWRRMRSSPIGRSLFHAAWVLALFAGEWMARNAIHEALGLHSGDVPYSYAFLSFIAGILCSMALTALTLLASCVVFWFLREFLYLMCEQFGFIRMINAIIAYRWVQFLLHLRKGSRLPKPGSDVGAFAFLVGGFSVGLIVTAFVVGLISIGHHYRQGIVITCVYYLDALADQDDSRLLRAGETTRRMRLQGTTITYEEVVSKQPSGSP